MLPDLLGGPGPGTTLQEKKICRETQILLHIEPRTFQDYISIEWNGVNICMNL